MISRWFPLLALALVGTAASAELTLGVHTEEPARSVAGLLAEARPGGRAITVRPFDDVSEMTAMLGSGELDLALLEEPPVSLPGVGIVADLYPGVLHILHRRNPAPATVHELLAGAPVWAGPPGGLGQHVARRLLADAGAAMGEPRLLADPWSQEPEAYFIFGGILERDALDRLGDYRLFSLGDPQQLHAGSVAEGLSLRFPNLRPFVLPAQLYPGLSREAALTLSVSNLLVARLVLEDSLVYELAMAVEGIRPGIALRYPLAGLPPAEGDLRQARALPVHPGAQRFRDRDLPGFFERNAEVLGLVVTLAVALASIVVAWRAPPPPDQEGPSWTPITTAC